MKSLFRILFFNKHHTALNARFLINQMSLFMNNNNELSTHIVLVIILSQEIIEECLD